MKQISIIQKSLIKIFYQTKKYFSSNFITKFSWGKKVGKAKFFTIFNIQYGLRQLPILWGNIYTFTINIDLWTSRYQICLAYWGWIMSIRFSGSSNSSIHSRIIGMGVLICWAKSTKFLITFSQRFPDSRIMRIHICLYTKHADKKHET